MKKSLYEWCIETPNKYKDSIVRAWTGIQVDNSSNKLGLLNTICEDIINYIGE